MTEIPIPTSRMAPHSADPKGLIKEAYNIEGISEKDCRSIFFDWTFGTEEDKNMTDLVKSLHQYYSEKYPSHPMTKVLAEGSLQPQNKPSRRRHRPTSK